MSEEIRNKVELLKAELDSVFDPSTFVLNSRTTEILMEIGQLQKQCKHHFVNGVCEFCKLEEG